MISIFRSRSIATLTTLMAISWSAAPTNASQAQEDPLTNARYLINRGEYEKGIRLLEDYIEQVKSTAAQKKKVAEAHYIIAKTYFRVGNEEDSIRHLRLAFSIYPELGLKEIDIAFLEQVDKFKAGLFNENKPGDMPPSIGGKSTDNLKLKKKKFPWLIIGAIAIVGVVVAILLLKKKTSSTVPPAKTGNIQVESTPIGSRIFLDGSDTGKETNNTITDIAVGYHAVKLVLAGYYDYEQTVSVQAGGTAPVSALLIVKEIEMIRIPGGTFWMGNDNDESFAKPAHMVTLSSFEIQKYEITQAQWESVMAANPSYSVGSGLPVESVNWDDVQSFIQKLNATTGKNYRLPTEAEWEYACRAGTTGDRYGDLNSIAWYFDNSGNRTREVGGKTPNGYGLYDMQGNVWEWCADWLGWYSSGAETNPTGPSSGVDKIARGGAFSNTSGFITSWYRGHANPNGRNRENGFRLARD